LSREGVIDEKKIIGVDGSAVVQISVDPT